MLKDEIWEKTFQYKKFVKVKKIAFNRIKIKFDIKIKWNKMSMIKIEKNSIKKRIQNKISTNKKK